MPSILTLNRNYNYTIKLNMFQRNLTITYNLVKVYNL